jgi:hypothetical protein
VRRPAAISTLQATNPRPRSTQPSSAAQATATPSPGARARRPHLGDTQTHATTRRQEAPASVSASSRSF